jgi:hypothetical protein
MTRMDPVTKGEANIKGRIEITITDITTDTKSRRGRPKTGIVIRDCPTAINARHRTPKMEIITRMIQIPATIIVPLKIHHTHPEKKTTTRAASNPNSISPIHPSFWMNTFAIV